MTTNDRSLRVARERVDTIINMLDEICDHMDGFSSAEEASLSMALCHAGNLRRSGRKQ